MAADTVTGTVANKWMAARPEAARSADKSIKPKHHHRPKLRLMARLGQATLAALLLAACAGGDGGGGGEPRGKLLRVGSGFVVAPSVIATADHVVRGCEALHIVYAPGRWPAELIAQDRDADIALLRSVGPTPPPLALAGGAPAFSTDLVLLGRPAGWPPFAPPQDVNGYIQQARRDGRIPVFTLDGAVRPGMSGGPAIDHAGGVVGLIVSRAVLVNNNAEIVPTSAILALMAEAGLPQDAAADGPLLVARIECDP